jgi:hypothetical protein
MRLLENLATTACNFQQRPCRGGAAPGRSGGSGRGAREPCLGAADMIPTERVRARRPDDPEEGSRTGTGTGTGRLSEFGVLSNPGGRRCGLSLQAAPALRRIPRPLLTAPHARPVSRWMGRGAAEVHPGTCAASPVRGSTPPGTAPDARASPCRLAGM